MLHFGQLTYGHGLGTVAYMINSTAIMNDNKWHYVSATLSSTFFETKLYLDGLLVPGSTKPAYDRMANYFNYIGQGDYQYIE